jgi:hypothetical protein
MVILANGKPSRALIADKTHWRPRQWRRQLLPNAASRRRPLRRGVLWASRFAFIVQHADPVITQLFDLQRTNANGGERRRGAPGRTIDNSGASIPCAKVRANSVPLNGKENAAPRTTREHVRQRLREAKFAALL